MGKHVTKRRGKPAEEDAVVEERPVAPLVPSPPPADEHRLPAISAAELYRRERARRGMDRPENDLLAEARAAYQALLAQEAASGKGGRPRSKAPAALRKEAAAVPDEAEVDLGATAEHEIADVEAHDDEPVEEAHDEVEVEEEVVAPPPAKRERKAAATSPAKAAPARGKAAAPSRAKAPARAKTPARKKAAAPPPRKKAGRGR